MGMHKPRLTTLADNIFAIAMTVLVIDIKVPVLVGEVINNRQLAGELLHLAPIFTSYILSFAVLATYWMSHHVVLSVFAKNIDKKLTHLNVPFLMAVTLIPFSSHLLGAYPSTQVAVIFYALNIIVIALLLLLMFRYVLTSKTIKNPEEAYPREVRFIYVRILVPLFCAILAIVLSVVGTIYSIYFLVFSVIFNLIPGGVHLIGDLLKKIYSVNKNNIKDNSMRSRAENPKRKSRNSAMKKSDKISARTVKTALS